MATSSLGYIQRVVNLLFRMSSFFFSHTSMDDTLAETSLSKPRTMAGVVAVLEIIFKHIRKYTQGYNLYNRKGTCNRTSIKAPY